MEGGNKDKNNSQFVIYLCNLERLYMDLLLEGPNKSQGHLIQQPIIIFGIGCNTMSNSWKHKAKNNHLYRAKLLFQFNIFIFTFIF